MEMGSLSGACCSEIRLRQWLYDCVGMVHTIGLYSFKWVDFMVCKLDLNKAVVLNGTRDNYAIQDKTLPRGRKGFINKSQKTRQKVRGQSSAGEGSTRRVWGQGVALCQHVNPQTNAAELGSPGTSAVVGLQ